MVKSAGFGSGGRWVLPPPASRDEAATEFGAEIPESAWLEICEAFERHGKRLDDLDGTRDNQNPNDKRGWHKRKADTQKRLEKALNALGEIDRDFLSEAEELVSLKNSGGIVSYNCLKRLETAMDEIIVLSSIVREVEPLSRDIPTKAESCKMLARDVFAALKAFGATLSNGWAIEQRAPSYADLTGFERLTKRLELHRCTTPKALAKWLRAAMAQDR